MLKYLIFLAPLLVPFLILAQTYRMEPVLCEGTTESNVAKGTEVTVCFQIRYDSDILWFRLRRAPVVSGIYVHWQKLLPSAVAEVITVDGTAWYRVTYKFKPDKSYHYNVSAVYRRPGEDFDRETQSSGHCYIGVGP